MKKIALILVSLIVFSGITMAQSVNFHSFTMQNIDGQDINLAQYKGKKVLVVNTASKCGLTPQYEGLEALYEKYKDKNFVIVGFPANNFLQQEPGTNNEIKQFCSAEYNITFPMMSKISVKGDDMHPLYQWLTKKSQNGKFDADVKWNFQKFMIDENGELVDFLNPKQKPDDEKLINWLEGK